MIKVHAMTHYYDSVNPPHLFTGYAREVIYDGDTESFSIVMRPWIEFSVVDNAVHNLTAREEPYKRSERQILANPSDMISTGFSGHKDVAARLARRYLPDDRELRRYLKLAYMM